MPQPVITQLTPEQEALIPLYRDKWHKIALSTQAIDRKEAEAAIKFVYAVLGLKQPNILFFGNPSAALKFIFNKELLDLDKDLDLKQIKIKVKKVWSKSLVNRLRNQFVHPLTYYLKNNNYTLHAQIYNELVNYVRNPALSLIRAIEYRIALDFKDYWGQDKDRLLNPIRQYLGYYWLVIQPEDLSCDTVIGDFYISALNGCYHQLEWKALVNLINSCGWIFPFEKICLVCDRPIKIYAKEKLLIQYADGYSVDRIYN